MAMVCAAAHRAGARTAVLNATREASCCTSDAESGPSVKASPGGITVRPDDDVLSAVIDTVRVMSANETTQEFFNGYTRALLDRDAAAIAGHYAVPALIAFPDQAIAVTDAAQTVQFFEGAAAQYDGVSEATAAVDVVAETGHSIWADVTWSYDGNPAERNMYQLVRSAGSWKVAVLTPLEL